MKNYLGRIWILFMCFCLVVSMSLIGQDGNIVLAVESTEGYGFELTTATKQVTVVQSEFFTTWNESDNVLSHVDTTHAESGTKSYRVNIDGAGNGNMYMNCSLDTETNYIVNTSFWLYYDSGEIEDYDGFKFYMYDKNDVLLWEIRFDGRDGSHMKYRYVDHNGVEQLVHNALDVNTWHKIWVVFNSNDSVDYGLINGFDGNTSINASVQPRNVVDIPTFKQMHFWIDNGYAAEEFWFDNFNCTFEDRAWWAGALGDITINVFNESNISQAITGWDVFIKTTGGAILYSLTGQSNPVVIDLYNIGFGDRIFEFYADGYYERYYPVTTENGANHTLTAYLPPTGLANLYYIQVVDGAASPIYNVFIELSRNFNGTVYDIAGGYTDVFGMYPIYLIGSQQYAINLSHSNYDSFYSTFIPDPNSYGYENPIIFTLGSQTINYTNETIFWEVIDFSAYITGGILYVNFTDSTGMTTDTSISIWEHNSSNSSNPALFHRDTRSDDNDFQLSYTVNTSNCYSITLDLNHTIFGYTHQYIDAICVRTGITTKTTFDDLLDLNFKYNPFGWSNVFGFFILIASLFSFGQHNVGVSMLFTGGILSFINSVIGLNLLTVSIPAVIIALGILVLWGEHGK